CRRGIAPRPVALALLRRQVMSLVEQVDELRRLLMRCTSGDGLEMAEIEEMTALEATLLAMTQAGRSGPGPQVAADALEARLRAGKAEDPGEVLALGPRAMTMTRAPYVEPGTLVELVIDEGALRRSYRFKARVMTLADDVDDLF